MKKALSLLFLWGRLSLSAIEYTPVNYDSLISQMPKIDKGLLQLHFQLYQGYVKQVNLLNSLLEEPPLKASPGQTFQFQAIKRQLGWEFNGMVLHELYFSNLGGKDKLSKNTALYKKMKEQWGSFDKWWAEFKQTCMERGIGWAILYYDRSKDRLYNAWVADHAEGPLVTAAPLLVIDLWEHAYLSQFGINREEYVDTIFDYVDWNVVNRRWKAALPMVRGKEEPKQMQLQESQMETTALKKGSSK